MAAKLGPRGGNPGPETTTSTSTQSLGCPDCPGTNLDHNPTCPYAADLDRTTAGDLAFFDAHSNAVLRRRPASWAEVSYFHKRGVPGRIRDLTVRRIDANTVVKLLLGQRCAMVSRLPERG